MDLDYCRAVLTEAGVELEPGLSEAELTAAERLHGFVFPPDLRALLAHALPSGHGFPNWREPDSPDLRAWMEWPIEGLWSDLDAIFWPDESIPRPSSVEVCRAHMRSVVGASTLIPIYVHRFIPDGPSLAGNPVFSIYGRDIIVYGTNLEDYLHNEFRAHLGTPSRARGPVREIAFWSQLLD